MWMEAAERINAAVRRTLGAPEGKRFIVGLSGGADSVALLAAMRAAGYDCVAAHCHFGLRGEESERDARFAAKIAEQLGAPFVMKRVDVEGWRSEHGGSVEMACRELRYRWFAELIEGYGAKAVAVAHHRDDNIETFMLNLLRGTGVAGLCGMGSEVRQPVAVVRPLLGVSRSDILAYLSERGLDYVTDSSNLANDYTRNRIRNLVLPAIREEFPSADHAIDLTMTHLREAAGFMEAAVGEMRNKYVGPEGEIYLGRMAAETPFAKFILHELMADAGLSRQQTDDAVEAALAGRSGKRFEAGGNTWILHRGVLRQASETTDAPEDGLWPFIIEVVSGEKIVPDSDVAYFSPEVLVGEPLRCRYWRQGDRLKPFGMKGSRKLSDIFSDAGLPVDMKERVPLLVKGDEILWVAGLRHSRLYRVETQGGKMVKVKYIHHKI